MGNALDSILRAGIVIVSDTGEYSRISEFNPSDATTNPSLILAAVSRPEFSHHVEDAVRYASSTLPMTASAEQKTEMAMDRMLVQVGCEFLRIIPGRVSISVDPRLAYNQESIVAKANRLISFFEQMGITRERVLIKIPATYEGILAARTLEALPLPIHTNMTLIFCPVQALACAQAGVSVISPFVGRVKDWWEAHPDKAKSGDLDLSSEHPGIALIHRIRHMFNTYGYTGRTQVMACGFRNVDEVIEVAQAGKSGGVDLLTLQLALLDELRVRDRIRNVAPRLGAPPLQVSEPAYLPSTTRGWGEGRKPKERRARFDRDLENEMIAIDKVPEGLEKFVKDTWGLEGMIRRRVEAGGYLSGSWNCSVQVSVEARL